MKFRIEKGKFCGEYISFIPPEGFNLDVQQDELKRSSIKFTSVDGSILLTVCLEQDAVTGIDGLVGYLNENDKYVLSEPRTVKRGNGSAIGVYYGRFQNSAEAYREVHSFRFKNEYMENQISVDLKAQGWRRIANDPIYTILGTPSIKTFFDSIEYFK